MKHVNGAQPGVKYDRKTIIHMEPEGFMAFIYLSVVCLMALLAVRVVVVGWLMD